VIRGRTLVAQATQTALARGYTSPPGDPTGKLGPDRVRPARKVAPFTYDGRILRTEPSVRLVLVVGSTSQLNVVDDGTSSFRKRHHMMEFEEAALRAATPRADERALAVVPLPDRSSYRCRDVS
jgi:hypothetical protein